MKIVQSLTAELYLAGQFVSEAVSFRTKSVLKSLCVLLSCFLVRVTARSGQEVGDGIGCEVVATVVPSVTLPLRVFFLVG